MKKYKDHSYADCPEPKKHHHASHRLIEESKPVHTPLPWKVDGKSILFANDKVLADKIEGFSTSDSQDEVNAAFIVRAVNCHEALLGALKDIYESILTPMAQDDDCDGCLG